MKSFLRSHFAAGHALLFVAVAAGVLMANPAFGQVLYSDSWNDDPDQASEGLPIYGVGVTDNTFGDEYPHYTETKFYDEDGTLVDQNTSSLSYVWAEAQVSNLLPWAENDIILHNCAETRHFRVTMDFDEEIGASAAQLLPRRFKAVYKKWGYDVTVEKWKYVRETVCVHTCQGSEYCLEGFMYEEMPAFIYIPGWKVGPFCLAIPPWPRSAAQRPACISSGFGTPIWTQTNCGS